MTPMARKRKGTRKQRPDLPSYSILDEIGRVRKAHASGKPTTAECPICRKPKKTKKVEKAYDSKPSGDGYAHVVYTAMLTCGHKAVYPLDEWYTRG